MNDEIGQPEYRRVMSDLSQQISDGRLAVGQPIPSTSKLEEMYGVSTTVIRRAVGELRTMGLLYGQPGKGVYVRAKPQVSGEEQHTLERLAAGLATVQKDVGELRSVDAESLEKLRTELADLRRVVAVLQTQLIDLYGRVGQPYPRDSAPLHEPMVEARSARASGA